MQYRTHLEPTRSTARSTCLLVLLVVVGCTTAPSPSPSQTAFYLDVANIDGPPVAIEINGRVVAQSRCQLDSGAGGPMLTPGPDAPLPWTVKLVRADGSVYGSWVETGTTGPRTILVRSDGVLEGPSVISGGPAPMPSETCPA
jgi:hypothetical protein